MTEPGHAINVGDALCARAMCRHSQPPRQLNPLFIGPFQNFGFCPGEGADQIWYTEVEGCTEASYVSSAADGVQRLAHPICGKPAHGTYEGSWAYPTETRTSYATVKVVKPDGTAQGAEALLPHPSDFDSHRVRKVTWKAEDGTDIVGLVCERDGKRRAPAPPEEEPRPGCPCAHNSPIVRNSQMFCCRRHAGGRNFACPRPRRASSGIPRPAQYCGQ